MNHYDAIKDRLSSLGWPVHFVEAPSTARAPYVVLWGPSSPTGGEDDRLNGARVDASQRVGVTCTAGTTAGVLTMQEAVRGVLCPGGKPTRLNVGGRAAWLTLWDSRDVQVDRDITMPGTDSHPAYGVDLYQIDSTPA